tara:strand:- start:1004 stop:1738 length:735 start_codon:yes stop_codon:yes gene_type:complete
MDKKVIVVMPAYYAEKTLEKTYNDIPHDLIDEIILVDDCSKDRTAEISRKLGITTIIHEKNIGYGGNQKTCFKAALKNNADIIIMVHPDYQYDPKKIPEILKIFENNEADVVYGSRLLLKGDAKKGGMPLYKRVGNFFLTTYMNFMLGTNFSDAATGYIAYKKEVLEKIPFLRNDDGFTFDEEAIIQCSYFNFRMKEFSVSTRYDLESSSISFMKGVKYGTSLFSKIARSKLHKCGVVKYHLLE